MSTKKFEYCTIKFREATSGASPADFTAWLNKMGEQGWELIGQSDGLCIFKREVSDVLQKLYGPVAIELQDRTILSTDRGF